MIKQEETAEADQELAQAIHTFFKIAKAHDDLEAALADRRRKLAEAEAELKLQDEQLASLGDVGRPVCELLMPVSSCRDPAAPPSCFVVRGSNVARSLVARKEELDREREPLRSNARVAMDLTANIITDSLGAELSPSVFETMADKPADVSWNSVGGLERQVGELREVVELPLTNPTIFAKVGVTPAKGVLLYGPPGTGKTLLARIAAASLNCAFLKVSGASLMQKYIGESAKLVREIFDHAKRLAPCVIFIDEVDAIAAKRNSDTGITDREVQRTLIELLSQLDGFDSLERVKVMMATNRPDMLDEALLRPGRLDKKIEIPLPDEKGRRAILELYLAKMQTDFAGDQVAAERLFKSVVGLSEGFNGADLKNLTTEAAYMALREDRFVVAERDFLSALRKLMGAKSLETQLTYDKV